MTIVMAILRAFDGSGLCGRLEVGQDEAPAAVHADAGVFAAFAEVLEAAVLEVDPGDTAAQVAEADLNFRVDAQVGLEPAVDPPGEHEPRRGLPGQDVAPEVLDAGLRQAVPAAALARLDH